MRRAVLPGISRQDSARHWPFHAQETSGGDRWYDFGTTVRTTDVANVTSAVYSTAGGYLPFSVVGHTYGPVDFQYSGTGGGGPSITQPPQNTVVVAGQTANFSVAATAGGVTGTFAYATLSPPITLNANTTYYLVSKDIDWRRHLD